jgi:hypothetical protein
LENKGVLFLVVFFCHRKLATVIFDGFLIFGGQRKPKIRTFYFRRLSLAAENEKITKISILSAAFGAR